MLNKMLINLEYFNESSHIQLPSNKIARPRKYDKTRFKSIDNT